MRWQGRERYVVIDADYGDGQACAALMAAWRADPQRGAHLHIIALRAPDAPGAMPGLQRMLLDEDGVTLDLIGAVIGDALAQIVARADAFVLHDATQAGARWAAALGRLAGDGATLTATALSAAQGHALRRSGFAFEAPAADGLLRARFLGRGAGAAGGSGSAATDATAAAGTAPPRRAIVIGAGLAGAAACERLCARGWQVTLFERHAEPAQEASGNRAGIFLPVLSRDDNLGTRLARAALLFALRYWERLGGIGRAFEGARCGVLQLARDAAHADIQREIAAARALPPDFARWLEAPAASELLGRPAPDGAWFFAQGGWAHPAGVCRAMLAACGARLDTRFGCGSVRLARGPQGWQVRDARGALLADAPVVVLANGCGATELAQARALPLTAVRGQVTHLAADGCPALPFVLCREAYIAPPAGGIVSVGASYDADGAAELCASSQRENLARARSMLGDARLGEGAPLAGRVGFRSVAPDRLPLVGALPAGDAADADDADDADDAAAAADADDADDAGDGDNADDASASQPGLYALLGYASRGLTWAPLCAELLAAQLDGEPWPLEASLAAALDPARFRRRALRRR